jgi:hypothetical protein
MKMPKQTFVRPNATQLAGWQQKITPVIDQWTKVVPDGAKVLTQFKAELANAKAGH